MRGIRRILVGLAFGAVLVAPPAPLARSQPAASDDPTVRRATVLVDHYLRALAQGNVPQIQGLLGGRAYGRRKRLLEENAAYQGLLIERYSGATYRILGHRWLDPETLAMDVRIVLADSEEVVTRFLFAQEKGRLVIAGETDPGL